MTEKQTNGKDFLIQSDPQERGKIENNEQSITKNLQTKESFFNNDLATLLGQGPIKRTPTRNTIEKIEIENTSEMDAQIKENFGENQERIIF
ncbi:MAG TPA: hypothetical protein PKC87_04050 [Candidatus Absconditabacterales bacterium]|nr:hypothetical protein [Candidatus Absconditabacterales bacterium]